MRGLAGISRTAEGSVCLPKASQHPRGAPGQPAEVVVHTPASPASRRLALAREAGPRLWTAFCLHWSPRTCTRDQTRQKFRILWEGNGAARLALLACVSPSVAVQTSVTQTGPARGG